MDGHWQRGKYAISTDKTRLDIGVIHDFLDTSYWAAGRSVETIRRPARLVKIQMVGGKRCTDGKYAYVHRLKTALDAISQS